MPESFNGYRLTNPTTKTAPFIYSSASLRVYGTIYPRRCNLLVLTGINGGDETRIVQLFESEPRIGMAPVWIVSVPRRGSFSWVPAQNGRVFNRLYFGVSTQPASYQPSSVGFWIDAEGTGLE